jgi:hypothetical protein
MFDRSTIATYTLPFKSVAASLLFTVLFGPIGLLYASFWGGLLMVTLGVIMLCARFFFLLLLVWLISCMWGVKAVERYNKQLLQLGQST